MMTKPSKKERPEKGYGQDNKMKTDQPWTERKKLFYFENALYFEIIRSEWKAVDKVFIVKK